MLNTLGHSTCYGLSRSRSGSGKCDLISDIFPTLNAMSGDVGTEETFSVRGFSSKFKKECTDAFGTSSNAEDEDNDEDNRFN